MRYFLIIVESMFMAQFIYTMQGVGKVVPPKREILKNIWLSFYPGAKIGVLGLNGSGKSSLLKIMAGVDKEFYEAKIATARFYMQKILPSTISLLSSITNGSKSMMQAPV